jgi:hypothetical protein
MTFACTFVNRYGRGLVSATDTDDGLTIHLLSDPAVQTTITSKIDRPYPSFFRSTKEERQQHSKEVDTYLRGLAETLRAWLKTVLSEDEWKARFEPKIREQETSMSTGTAVVVWTFALSYLVTAVVRLFE